MAKINVCDICQKDGKLTETKTYMSVKGKPYLRIDYCPGCKNKIPEDMTEYRKLAARLQNYPENFFVDLDKPKEVGNGK